MKRTRSDSAASAVKAMVPVPSRSAMRSAVSPPVNPWWHGSGDQYVAFLVDALMPLIDRDFRTIAARSHTGIFGSSQLPDYSSTKGAINAFTKALVALIDVEIPLIEILVILQSVDCASRARIICAPLRLAVAVGARVVRSSA